MFASYNWHFMIQFLLGNIGNFMKLIDNHIEKLGDDLKNEITESGKIRKYNNQCI